MNNPLKYLAISFSAEDLCALSGECVGEHESCVTTGLYSECVCDEGYVGHDCEGTSLRDTNNSCELNGVKKIH